MRIAAFYDVAYPWVCGGGEKRLFHLAKELVKRGHEVHLYSMTYWEPEQSILRDGVHFHGIMPAQGLYGVDGKRRVSTALRFAASILPVLLRERFDVIDFGSFPFIPALVGSLTCRLNRQPHAVTWIEQIGKAWPKYFPGAVGVIGGATERALLRVTPHAVAISEFVRERLIHAGYPPERITVVPMGFVQRTVPPFAERTTDLLFIGRLQAHKRVDLFLRAAGVLRDSGAEKLRAVVLGGGPLEEQLHRIADELSLSRTVEFIGNIPEEELFTVLRSAKVLVQPSEREGLGLTVLEAFSCGTPVIVCDSPENAAVRLVRNGQNGLVVPPRPDAIADAWRTISADFARYSDEALCGSREYMLESVVDELERCYQKIAR